ncbi:uncharacterized protein [Choristoneura fumiferana]|uniref:uncharacterized protein n=1 Tax=Choristoneura fumiferana TaxID=7141 RepID=UPI003D156383
MSIGVLIKKRASLKCKLTNFKTFLTPYQSIKSLSELQISEVECRLSKIEDMYSVFDELQEQIEIESENPDEQYKERTEFENQYYALLSCARELLRVQSKPDTKVLSEAGFSSCQHKNDLVRLPKINLPHFNGDYQNFLEFRDTFKSLIHNNDSIDNINKFHYLRASLQGSAALVIKSLDFKGDNYKTAWELLMSRYNNERLLVNNHVKALFSVDQIQRESHKALRHMLDVTNKNLRGLTTLGQPTDHWDTLIIYMMSTKLDSVTSREWEEHRNSLKETPTLENFTTFICNRADLLETLEEGKSSQTKPMHQSFKQKNFLVAAMVQVSDAKGTKHIARILLDNGSTTNFVTEKLRSKLQLPLSSTSSTVTGINNSCSKSTQSCKLTIHSMTGGYKTELRCLVLPEITKLLPSSYINKRELQIPSHIQLGDPSFNIPSVIDILAGAEIFWDVIGSSRISLGKRQPILYDSKLGWIISGSVISNQNHHTVCHVSELHDTDIDRQLTRFWELDGVSPVHNFTPEERICEQHFVDNTTRSEDGRFVVSMPLKESTKVLGDSYEMAKCRFLSLEKRLKREPEFRKNYNAFMTEYLKLGHMSRSDCKLNDDDVDCFLPHHGVIRESSTTTKLRVVFDASAVTKSGVSLNAIQMVGPTVQDDLISILLRFRQHKYVISGDIEKMYRQILISPEQRRLQQILWRFNPTDRLQCYNLNTVTYGTASAPYLATRCLKQLGLESSDPVIQHSITHDFYVDDYLSGSSSISEAIQLGKGVIDSLSSAQLNLRKLRSNSTEILDALQGYTNSTDLRQDNVQGNLNVQNLSTSAAAKTLGLYWQCDTDTLIFDINLASVSKVTKRHVLSSIAQVFDPVGLVGPCIVEAKVIMQKLWQHKYSWDEEIPTNLNLLWTRFEETLPFINRIKIPRWILFNSVHDIELHIFTDASEVAYGTCAYVRSKDTAGAITVRLLASKNKIAPIKPTTIPRLELCGVLLGSRLFTKLLSSLTLKFSNVFFWCDSMIVLAWLESSPTNLKPFVRNRVSEVQDVTAGHTWNYVPTKENPADLVSRGMNAKLLASSALWWTGPEFLKQDSTSWPASPSSLNTKLPEMVPCLVTDTQESPFSLLTNRVSTFSKIIRVVAYIKRFINNCSKNTNKKSGFLQSSELMSAQKSIVSVCQKEMFEEEFSLLKSGKSLPPKNKLLPFTPYIDSDNLLKVGGRLDNTYYSEEVKHPIMLCSKHRLTKLIFDYFHLQFLHAGPQLLLNSIKQLFWPLGGRNLARKTVKNCVTCCRFKGQTIQPIMGNLPAARAQLDSPFSNTGTDYAGPIMIADRKGRGCKLIKAWICIYVCFAVKAVHLELVSDLTKEAFMASLNRFIARRGKPTNIYCDNATYYTGTCNELYRVLKSPDVASDLAQSGINFVFSPPYSPHFGSLWERCVRSVKHHLRRILNLTHLTFEEMTTCLSEIEAVLNSRPMTPISSEPSDLTALTPAHFLIGRPLMFVPSSSNTALEKNINCLHRFQRVEQLKRHFWNRFQLEYVSQLQKKTKWFSSHDKLTEGALVIVKEKGAPPLMWLLGRIMKIYPGRDGVARVADIKTKKGIIKRAFNNICPLPTSTECSS